MDRNSGRKRSTVDSRAATWLSSDGSVRVALGFWLIGSIHFLIGYTLGLVAPPREVLIAGSLE
jgi:hypothetical protein